MGHALLPCLGFFCVGMVAAGTWLMRDLGRAEVRQRRIASVRLSVDPTPDAGSDAQNNPLLRLIIGVGMVLARSGRLPAATIAELEQTLVSAGFRQSHALALFIGSKLLLFLSLPTVAYFLAPSLVASPMLRLMLTGAAAVLGLLLPDVVVGRRRAAHLKAVGRGLPDALDMLVICSEAGLGLETGMERVANEIVAAHPAVAAELKLTCGEMRVLSDRRVALINMGTRTGLDTLKRLGGTLAQTLQYGTPLSQALRTLATEMRYEMLMRFEAQAARLPVLLTLPMILFILPCVFIVVGGPAGLTVARTLIHH